MLFMMQMFKEPSLFGNSFMYIEEKGDEIQC